VPPTPTPDAGPVILAFGADVEEADPGDTIRLTWESRGAVEATLYHLLPTGQYSEPVWEVAPSGSQEYTIPPEMRNQDGFVLIVEDGAGRTAQATTWIDLRCPDTWFFSPAPDICPAGPPLVSDGAEQHFERGVMLWNRAERRIYVLFNDTGYTTAWRAYTDTWEEGDPESDPSIVPPEGLYQPIRGFGRVWREEPHVRDRLGWALAPEVGYETALQTTSHFKYRTLYIRAHDGGVWELGPEGSAWQHIP
jgi:hypothetical protein